MTPQEQRIIAARPFRMSSLMSLRIERIAAAPARENLRKELTVGDWI